MVYSKIICFKFGTIKQRDQDKTYFAAARISSAFAAINTLKYWNVTIIYLFGIHTHFLLLLPFDCVPAFICILLIQLLLYKKGATTTRRAASALQFIFITQSLYAAAASSTSFYSTRNGSITTTYIYIHILCLCCIELYILYYPFNAHTHTHLLYQINGTYASAAAAAVTRELDSLVQTIRDKTCTTTIVLSQNYCICRKVVLICAWGGGPWAAAASQMNRL